MISSQTVDQIRWASDITEVVGGYLPLKRQGANFVALCPFHHEKTPSFAVNPRRQIFHCFGCHKGGDVFAFLREYEGLTFVEAVERLARRAGIQLEFEKDAEYQKERSLKEAMIKLHEQVARYWQRCLAESSEAQGARDYLKRRGVGDEAIREFRLGYAPNAGSDLVEWVRKQGYDLEWVEQAGLIARRERGGFYDRFRGRLIFPITDDQGRTIGFSGRILTEEAKAPKYVNSPETPLFHKAKVIYGLDKAKRAMLDAGSAVVCEGQLDLIACHRAGLRHVVAPQGSALTGQHARVLRRYVQEVILCFDSDPAGRKAAVRSLDELLGSGLAIRVAEVPAPHDPDSYLKEFGAEAFEGLLRSARSFFDFYLDHLLETHDPKTDKGQTAIVRAMAEAVQKTGDEVLVDRCAQKTAMKLAVRPEVVRDQFRKWGTAAQASRREAEEGPSEETDRPNAQELWLIKLLFAEEEGAPWVADYLELEWLQHQAVRQIVTRKFERDSEGRGWTAGDLIDDLPEEGARRIVTEALSDDREIPEPTRQLTDLLTRLRNQFIDRQLNQLTQRLGSADSSEEELSRLLEYQMRLRRQKQEPLQPRAT